MLINTALKIAIKAHKGQYRKFSNLDYIVHPLEVATIYAQHHESPIGYAIALLHDVIEDSQLNTETLYASLVKGGVTSYQANMVSNCVWHLSKDGTDYQEKLKAGPYTAQFVKLCDIMSNVGDRYWHLDEPKLARYKLKKQKDFNVLDKIDETHPLKEEVRKLLWS